MTNLNKAVKRRISGLTRRDVVVTLYPGGLLGIRESRARKEYTLPIMTCYRLAVESERLAKVREKKAARDRAKGKR